MVAILNRSSICVIIILLARGGESLQCWICSTLSEPGCDDPFKPSDLTAGVEYFLHDCYVGAIMNGSLEEQLLMERVFGPEAKEYCRKTVREVYGVTLVYRGCSYGDVAKDCTDADGCHACFKDGCNAATKLSPIFLLLSIVFLYTTRLIMICIN